MTSAKSELETTHQVEIKSSLNRNKAQWSLISAGFLILMAVAYMDNVRGPLLPVMTQELAIPYTYAGLFLAVGNLSAVISMFFLNRLLKVMSDRQVTVSLCLIAMLPGLLAPWIQGVWGLMLVGVILGSCVAMLGAMSNILTIKGAPTQLRGKFLSAQQVMYGIGSFMAPFLFAQSVQLQLPWWSVIGLAAMTFASLASVFVWKLPNDKPAPPVTRPPTEGRKHQVLAILAILAFGLYVGGEVLASMWMSTFMVQELQLAPEEAANYVGGFFIMLGATRFLSFVFVRPKWEMTVILACVILGILALFVAQTGKAWAFALVGVLGPFYPLFMAEISRSFPETWQGLTIWVFVCIQTSLGLIHLSVGHITDLVGIKLAFLISPALLLVCLLSLTVFFRLSRRKLSS